MKTCTCIECGQTYSTTDIVCGMCPDCEEEIAQAEDEEQEDDQ